MYQGESSTAGDVLLPHLKAGSLTGSGIDLSDPMLCWFSPGELSALSLRKNDLLVAEGGSIGRCAILSEDLPLWGFQKSLNRVRARGEDDIRFLSYLIQCATECGHIAVLCGRSTIQHFTAEKLANLDWPHPSPIDQEAIADFLDKETAKIDELIAKQEQLIGTLREDRTATITHVVTEGLDPGVELTQSADEMLPSSPVHWTQRVPLKRVASVQTGLTLGKSVEPAEAVSVPYLRVANVQTGAVNLDEVKTVEVHRAEVNNYLLRAGDVLMTEGGDIDKLGRGCLWSGEISPCIHQNHVFAVRCNDELDSQFLVYLLDTSIARNYFFMTAKKTTNLASTNSTTLGRFYFSLPPRREQNHIVKFLDTRSANIDMLIAKANEVIATLREYRSALITDAVTGNIDVRGAA
jgi:type I restriction enzyme S subunit